MDRTRELLFRMSTAFLPVCLRAYSTLMLFFCAGVGALYAQERISDPGVEMMRRALIATSAAPEDVQDLIVKDRIRDPRTGVEHLYMKQRWQGIEVFTGDLAMHVLPSGKVFGPFGKVERDLASRAKDLVPAIGPEQALRARAIELGWEEASVRPLRAEANTYWFSLDGAQESPFVQLVLLPVGDAMVLAWNVNIQLPDGSHWWNIRSDAMTGRVLDRNDWVAECNFDDHGPDHGHGTPFAPLAPNDYNVYARPLESPNFGSRSIQNAPWLLAPNASPFGWHDTNGSAGPEFTITRGNNVWAQEDADGNNGTGYSPDGGATLDFDFPINLANAPSTYQDAAITNLFYWNNIIHDILYQYGFDEVSGNFQVNNYGNGGLGTDEVLADAQDGSGTNNANFGTPPDGSNPRMQMFLWSGTPQVDGDLDNGIIVHEYGHGVSNRLVGGPSNTSCLSNAEQMGEGWSDYLGLILTMEPGDLATDARGIGTFALGQLPSGVGIRPAPYSTDFGVNGYTYANTNSGLSQPHGIGFVWCTMLWEMTWDLIAQDGFVADIYSGTGGNGKALALVLEGMKLTPCNPGFVDARDAILAADQILYNGVDQQLIWAAFARRGLGASADQGSSTSRSDQSEAFDLPVDNNMSVTTSIVPVAGPLYACANGDSITVVVRNAGLLDQWNVPVSFRIDNGPVVTELITDTVRAGNSLTHVFANLLNITGVGPHSFKAWTALATDQYLLDDTVTVLLTLELPRPLPFSEDVEGGMLLPAGWSLLNPDNGTTWTRVNISNGADCVASNTWRMDHYTYSSIGQEDFLISPQLDLTALSNVRLRFDHAYTTYSSSYTDGLRVEVTSDCGQTWVPVFAEAGTLLATAPASTSVWSPANCSECRTNLVDLSAYTGDLVQIRFVAENGYGNVLYLDNIRVESPPDTDISVVAVLGPTEDPLRTCETTQTSVVASVSNQGVFTLSNIPLSYSLDGGAVVTESLAGPLLSGSTVQYTFTAALSLPTSGDHVLKVWSTMPGDLVLSNDTAESLVRVAPLLSVPFLYDLEAESTCPVTTNCGLTVCPLNSGWTNAVNGVEDDIDWRVDQGGTVSSGTGPTVDLLPGTATGNYIYLEASGTCTARTALLTSPCISLVGTGMPKLTYGRHMLGASMGELHVDLFDGLNWVNDIRPMISGDQGANWQRDTVDLSPWAGGTVLIRFRGITGSGFASDLALDAIEVFDAAPAVQVALRVFLSGPYDAGSGIMRDDLRVAGLLPAMEPYTGSGYVQVGSGGEVVDAGVFTTTGADAIVDWVRVEVRDGLVPSNVIATANGLVQRDGDIVSTDGSSPLALAVPAGGYHIAVLHRNHQGCMTASTVALVPGITSVDLTLPGTNTFGTAAQQAIGGIRALWAGEVQDRQNIKYTGAGNDRDPILQVIGGSIPTATVSGYLGADVNMDGSVKYTGTANDRDVLLGTIGGSVPTNIRVQQLP